jgi:replicative superfamily II helicase
MAIKQPDSLISEFKDVIKQITVEVTKQSIVQDLKRSEETMKQSSTQLQPIVNKLGESAGKLEELLRKNSADLQGISQRLTKLEELVRETTRSIADKNDAANKQTTNLLNESISSLRNSIHNTSEANQKLSNDISVKIVNIVEEENARSRKSRQWMFSLLGIQLVLILVVLSALYFLLK